MTDPRGTPQQSEPVLVDVGDAVLEGDLTVPATASGLVIFAHGSGSSRFSSRNRFVAGVLQDAGLATLLLDLLTADEERQDAVTGHLRFDVPRLARRLAGAARWMADHPLAGRLAAGYFGASTGGGAALIAAAEEPERIAAVVSRGGRPDLAGESLSRVPAPTLLLVGELDRQVIDLNRQAMARMTAPVELEVVPRAGHLFEEPGTLELVAERARDWFLQHLGGSR